MRILTLLKTTAKVIGPGEGTILASEVMSELPSSERIAFLEEPVIDLVGSHMGISVGLSAVQVMAA
jgi:hypothetical protein